MAEESTGNNTEIVVLADGEALVQYESVSSKFQKFYEDTIDGFDSIRSEYAGYIVQMHDALIRAGFTKENAKKKMREDHKHLRGFSKTTINRALPQEQKRIYRKNEEESPNVSNETCVQSNTDDNIGNNEIADASISSETVDDTKKIIEELKIENKRLKEENEQLKNAGKSEEEYLIEVPRRIVGTKDDILIQLTNVIEKLPDLFHLKVKGKRVIGVQL